MLYLNVSEHVMRNWSRTVDLYYSFHLSGINTDIESVNLLIEQRQQEHDNRALYYCELNIHPCVGEHLQLAVESENCGVAIEQSFAKAKRYMLRRMRGISDEAAAKMLG